MTVTRPRLVRLEGIDGRVHVLPDRRDLERMSEAAKQQMICDMNRNYGEWHSRLLDGREPYSSKYF